MCIHVNMYQRVHSSVIYNLPQTGKNPSSWFPWNFFPSLMIQERDPSSFSSQRPLQWDPGGGGRLHVKGEERGKSKSVHSPRDQEEMRWVKRDSPEVPGTRANRSPEREVSRARDFPRGNTEERAPVFSWVFKDFCHLPSCRSSCLTSLPASALPPAPSSVQPRHSVASHWPAEKPPNSLARHSRRFRIQPPVFLPDSRDTGLLAASPTCPIHSSGSPAFACSVPATGTLHPCWLSASYSILKIPFKCHLLCQSLTSPRSMSHPFLCVPPPLEHTARGVFIYILSTVKAGTMCFLVTTGSPVTNQCLTHSRCPKHLLQEWLNERESFNGDRLCRLPSMLKPTWTIHSRDKPSSFQLFFLKFGALRPYVLKEDKSSNAPTFPLPQDLCTYSPFPLPGSLPQLLCFFILRFQLQCCLSEEGICPVWPGTPLRLSAPNIPSSVSVTATVMLGLG